MVTTTKQGLRVSVLQENFAAALSEVVGLTRQSTSMPILSHVLLRTEGGRLAITATDLSTTITTWIGCQVDSGGAVTLPGDMVAKLVAALPPERIDLLQPDPEVASVVMKCGRSKTRISGFPAGAFPPVTNVEGQMLKFTSGDLARAISLVAPFAAFKDTSRPVLLGVNLSGDPAKPGVITWVSADGFRLTVYDCPVEGALEGSPVIPAVALLQAGKLLKKVKPEEIVDMIVGPVSVSLSFGDTDFRSQRIAGTFPNYKQLIPDSGTTVVTISAEVFAGAVKRASLIANDGSGIVRLCVGALIPGVLEVSAVAQDTGEITDEIEAQVTGESNAKIAANSYYLSSCLAAVGEGEIKMSLSTPSSPMRFDHSEIPGYLHVIMPMFVQW